MIVGWGSRLQEQEAEEEEQYLLEQQRQEQVGGGAVPTRAGTGEGTGRSSTY